MSTGNHKSRWTTMVDKATDRLIRLLRLAFWIIEGIVLLRVTFKVLGADGSAAFAALVYRISDPLVAPFHPIFRDQNFNGHPFEWGSLVAVVLYAFAVWLLVRIIRIVVHGS